MSGMFSKLATEQTSGLMSDVDKAALDALLSENITGLSTIAGLASTVAGTVGTSLQAARADHTHPTDESANSNYVASSFGVGAAPIAGVSLFITQALTGSTYAFGGLLQATIQSDVTQAASGFATSVSTLPASFNLTNLRLFNASQGTIGAGSSITNQVAFYADPSLIGATNNYGFYGAIPAGTGRWNLYMSGTASNYIASTIGIGTTISGGINGTVNLGGIGSPSAGYLLGFSSTQQISNTVTTEYDAFVSLPSTVASPFTLATLNHYKASQGIIGSGSSVTTQVGFNADSSLANGSSNYGFYGNINSGTNNYNLYMSSNAKNYLAGSLGIGTTNITQPLTVNGNAAISGTISGSTWGGNTISVSSGGTGTTSLSGIVKGNGTSAFTAAVANTDYLTPPTGTTLVKANNGGALLTATAGTDYLVPPTGTAILKANNGGTLANAVAGVDYQSPIGTISGVVKGSGANTLIAAVAGMDFLVPPSGTAMLKANSGSGLANAVAGLDYLVPPSGNSILKANTGGALVNAIAGTDYIAPPSGTALLKGNNGGALANAVAGTDYLAPGTVGAANGLATLNASSQLTASQFPSYITTVFGIGAAAPTGTMFYNNLVYGSSIDVIQNSITPTIPNTTTNTWTGYSSKPTTASVSFTLGTLTHFLAAQGTLGVGNTVTNQIGFNAGSTLSSATNNYGFVGNVPLGTNNFNLYMGGSAPNYLAGTLTVANTTVSTSASTGALTVAGGVGVSGTTNFGGVVNLNNAINQAPPVTISSSASVAIGAAASNNITITGNTAISSFDVAAIGVTRVVTFAGVLVLTNDNTKLILPAGISITTTVNDTAEFVSLGSGNWKCLRYNYANGSSSSGGSSPTSSYTEIYLSPTIGQTVFIIGGGYTVGSLDVFINGILLYNGRDYTATDGTTFTLSSGALITDSIMVRIWLTGTVYSQMSTNIITPTVGQTVFPVSGGYALNCIDVYQNGILLFNGVDYTATDSSTFVLATPAISSDSFLVRVWANSNIFNSSFPDDIKANGVTLGTGGGGNSTNTAIGLNALANNTTGTNNFAIGNGAGTDTVQNITTQNNTGVLGNNNTTAIYSKVGLTITSDIRDKTDIKPVPLGLDFINKINPISYKLKVSRNKDIPVGRTHYGFNANEIADLQREEVIVDETDPNNLKLNPEDIIAVLVNAVKEQQKIIKALNFRVSLLEQDK